MPIGDPPGRREADRLAEAWNRTLCRNGELLYPPEGERRSLETWAADVIEDYFDPTGEPHPTHLAVAAILLELATGDALVSQAWEDTPLHGLPLPQPREAWALIRSADLDGWCSRHGVALEPPTGPDSIILPFVPPSMLDPEAIRYTFGQALTTYGSLLAILSDPARRQLMQPHADETIRLAAAYIRTGRWRVRQLLCGSQEGDRVRAAAQDASLVDHRPGLLALDVMDLATASMITLADIGIHLFHLTVRLRDGVETLANLTPDSRVEKMVAAKPLREWASGKLGGADFTILEPR